MSGSEGAVGCKTTSNQSIDDPNNAERPPEPSASPTQDTDSLDDAQIQTPKVNGDHGPRGRKRKLDEISKLRSGRRTSPPWNFGSAGGPSSFMVGGRRKSSRTNGLPPHLQQGADERRTTRGAVNAWLRVENGDRRSSAPASLPDKARTSRSVGKPASNIATRHPRPERSANATPASTHRPMRQAGRERNSTRASPATPPHNNGSTIQKGRSRRRSALVADSPSESHLRSSRRLQRELDKALVLANGHHEPSPPPSGKVPRLRFRLRPPSIPVSHPGHIPKEKKYTTFAEWLKHDDPLAGEEEDKITDQSAAGEAAIRLKILKAAEPGGPLSRDRCSLYLNRPQEGPPQQYGHHDHMVAHAIHLHMLMAKERQHFISLARRLAREAVEVWKKKYRGKHEAVHVKTKEELEQEERQRDIRRYRQVVKDLSQAWTLVKAEVDMRRLKRWEEEQHALGKQALDEMLDQSTLLLNQRVARRPSEISSDVDMDDEEGGSDFDDVDGDEDISGVSADSASEASNDARSDVMTTESSEDEEEDGPDDDEGLTQEELRAKYSTTEAVPWAESSSEDGEGQDGDDTESDDEQDSLALRSPLLLEMLDDGATSTHDPEDKPSVDPEAPDSGIDPSMVELEEVDDILLDDEESEDSDGSEDESDNSSQPGASEVESDSEGEGLLGFLSKSERREIQRKPVTPVSLEEFEGPRGEDMPFGGSPEWASSNPPSRAALPAERLSMPTPDTNTPDSKAFLPQPPRPSSLPISSSRASPSMHPPSPQTEDRDKPDALMTSDPTPPPSSIRTEIPSLLRGKLREYQHEGLDWLAGLYAGNTNGILADEMGLGKTIQTIALLAHLADRSIWGPHLIVVPTSVMLNWEMEFKKFCPGFKILTYYGQPEERKRKRKGWMDDSLWNVVITSYHLILKDLSAFKKRSWHYLVLDEAHHIKNFQTQRWQSLLNFKTERRLLLTGTPLQNNVQELWSLLFFLMPGGEDGTGAFTGLDHFNKALSNPSNQILDQGRQELDVEAQRTVKKLHEVLRPYLLRRLKADVEKQMPAKYEHVVYCRLSKRQRQLYDGFMGRADTKATLASGNYMSIMNCLMSLRKVCNHPDLFETRQIVTSFAIPRSVAAEYEIKDLLVRKRLLDTADKDTINLDVLNLLPVTYESRTAIHALKGRDIRATRPLNTLVERETRRLKPVQELDGSSLQSVFDHIETSKNHSVVDHLRNCVDLTIQRTERFPVYGAGLLRRLNINFQDRLGARAPPPPRERCSWYMNTSSTLLEATPTLPERGALLRPIIERFGCVTPHAVAADLAPLTLTSKGTEMIRQSQDLSSFDPFHEPRIRLSIAFPDKRLLQYDCGKLQRLDKLLRELQAGGHRALIFTQMTKVLDILEQFLNIHGHRYLRLDGATKIEQRQILTDRFNNDPRILVFILSSRSGGLGINLTGADTVIFYDLDWNPAMDKQCQDRCHRIGQTRDVHIYRFVSEYTIEANILRKSNQKRLLDDVIIQRGDFTTDYFNRLSYRDALDDGASPLAEDAEASAAMDRVLGDVAGLSRVLESVEDKEDTEAAKVAQREIVEEIHMDDNDFDETARSSTTPRVSVPPTPAADQEDTAAQTDGDADDNVKGVDEYMLGLIEWELRDKPVVPPSARSRRKTRKGHEHRVRRRRA